MSRSAAAGAAAIVALLLVTASACGGTSADDARSAAAHPTATDDRPGPHRASGPSHAASATVTVGPVQVTGRASPGRLRQVGRAAGEAARRVRAVWGADLLRHRIVVDVADGEQDFRALGGGAEPGAAVAATTTASGRIVLAPQVFTALTAQGRLVVLTHELTHLAFRQSVSAAAAGWVVEGSAEYTAYRQTGRSMADLAPAVAELVRSGATPTGPPDDHAFTSGPQRAYQSAYTWCAFLVERSGLPRFTRFVRAAVGSRGGPATARIFHGVYGAEIGALGPVYARFLRARLATSDGPGTATSTTVPSGAGSGAATGSP